MRIRHYIINSKEFDAIVSLSLPSIGIRVKTTHKWTEGEVLHVCNLLKLGVNIWKYCRENIMEKSVRTHEFISMRDVYNIIAMVILMHMQLIWSAHGSDG